MKHLLILVVLLTTWGNAWCQLEPFQDEDAMVTPNFNEVIIKSKKISQISIHYFTKPDGATINDDGIVKCYYFDTAGKIIQSVCTTRTGENSCDSVKCSYYYDESGNITIKRTKFGDFFDTWYYRWSKDHLLQTEAHIHETSGFAVDGSFKVGTQKVISSDSFAYINYPKQLQQFAYNEDNKVFQKTIIQYDENKRLLSRNSHYAVGWLFSEVDLNYDSKGYLISYNNSGNLNGDMNKSTIIKYDSTGRTDEQEIWVSGKQKHHIEFMYDNSTGLVTNKLDRDEEKAVIYIIKFSYETYSGKGLSTATR